MNEQTTPIWVALTATVVSLGAIAWWSLAPILIALVAVLATTVYHHKWATVEDRAVDAVAIITVGSLSTLLATSLGQVAFDNSAGAAIGIAMVTAIIAGVALAKGQFQRHDADNA